MGGRRERREKARFDVVAKATLYTQVAAAAAASVRAVCETNSWCDEADIELTQVPEICIGLTLGLFAGGLWKMHQWNEQRKTRAFYDMLEKGEISVVAAEE
ncbi:hypothetical protein OPV22_002043 [Ensete ventricosum]|uniref:Cytochrome c oxidase subunit 5C n=1 Tax=Ensete ventricosum TaxID=4639 RepID=A0AAV8RWS6_ENSVE|nr:hypothetical protein OPV22_002043 [Ensete ventricosum]